MPVVGSTNPPTPSHHCELPKALPGDVIMLGAVFRCDACDTLWSATWLSHNNGQGGTGYRPYWSPYDGRVYLLDQAAYDKVN